MPPRFAPGALRRFRTLRAALQTLALLPSSAPLRVRTPPPASARGGPDNKKAPIVGSSKFKLAEEEGFEPS